ncbi:MAG: hypothetical protein ACETWE_14055 [Candidatus Bathyarchaeia archaeon]
MEETILSCNSEDADRLADLLLGVKTGNVVITNVTKAAGNLVEISFEWRRLEIGQKGDEVVPQNRL